MCGMSIKRIVRQILEKSDFGERCDIVVVLIQSGQRHTVRSERSPIEDPVGDGDADANSSKRPLMKQTFCGNYTKITVTTCPLPSKVILRVSNGLILFSLLVSQTERRIQKAVEPPRV